MFKKTHHTKASGWQCGKNNRLLMKYFVGCKPLIEKCPHINLGDIFLYADLYSVNLVTFSISPTSIRTPLTTTSPPSPDS